MTPFSTFISEKTRMAPCDPHALCIPLPGQGHINPMLMLAKVLHHKGFYITFVNTNYGHRLLLESHGDLPNFRTVSISDASPDSDANLTHNITAANFLEPFCELIEDLNRNSAGDIPPVSCIISDLLMIFTVEAAERFRLPVALVCLCASSLLASMYYSRLIEEGLIPLKDWEQLRNGYLDTTVDGIPGLNHFRLRDFPTFIRTTDSNDYMLNFSKKINEALLRAQALIINTFDAIEEAAINALTEFFRPIYSIGPLHLQVNSLPESPVKAICSSPWKQDHDCIKWLDTQARGSVIYINFGSVTTLTAAQLTEFAWGLSNSGHTFLWIIRPDLVSGVSAILPEEFVNETKERSFLTSWCAQEEVLKHEAIGGFLTHCGWNSTIESITNGVPLLCMPFFMDQPTNCRLSCVEWGIGMEIDNNVKRDEVEKLVRELMEGNKGKKMKEKAVMWRRKAEEAVAPTGSSDVNLNKLIEEILLG